MQSPVPSNARNLNIPAVQKRLAARDNWRCHYCHKQLVPAQIWKQIQAGTPPDTRRFRSWANIMQRGGDMATIDHLVPVIRGGSKDLSNLVLACYTCNRAKGNRDYAEFINGLSARQNNLPYVRPS